MFLRCANNIHRTFTKLARPIDPDGSDADIVRDVESVFRAARAQNPACRVAIGGTVVAAIDNEGFRWLCQPGTMTGVS